MALLQLTEEQIRTWTREQKDEWWLTNVYRGDMPQLTLRSGLTGFVLGGVLAATAMYIGAKTGISIGVGLTSVILAFAIYRIMAGSGLAKDFTILENNCTQSIATAAGYMIGPMISCLAAYMLLTGRIIPWWHMIMWMCVVSIIGVLLAFPMKRRFINEEQLPFPEGRASGVVLDALYTGAANEGMFKARLLGVTALLTGLYQAGISEGWMKLLQFKLLRMDRWAGLKEPWIIHERLDTYYYAMAAKVNGWIPTILGTDIRQLGLRLTLDCAMIGVGGLMGIAVATSCLLGALINFVVLAPIMIQAGDIVARVGPNGAVVPISRAEIVNQWSLWWGVVMMVVGSLVSLLGRPEIFKGIFRRGKKPRRRPRRAEAHRVAAVDFVGRHSALQRAGRLGDTCVLRRAVAARVHLAAADLRAVGDLHQLDGADLVDAYRLVGQDHAVYDGSNRPHQPGEQPDPGGNDGRDCVKFRQLAVGHQARLHARRQAAPAGDWSCDRHLCGGACVRAAVLPAVPAARRQRRAHGRWSRTSSRSRRRCSGRAWPRSSARVLARCRVGGCLYDCRRDRAAAIEVARMATKGRFGLSAVAIGLGVVLPPESTFAMFVGALLFWVMGRRHRTRAPRTRVLGRRPRAHLRRLDLGLGTGGDRQRDCQCADELKTVRKARGRSARSAPFAPMAEDPFAGFLMQTGADGPSPAPSASRGRTPRAGSSRSRGCSVAAAADLVHLAHVLVLARAVARSATFPYRHADLSLGGVEGRSALPDHVLRTSFFVWHDEQAAAIGLIFVSFLGSTSIDDLFRPRG